MQIIVKTLAGLENVLAQELEQLQLLNIEVLNRAVSCEGNWAQLYKCNYQLRTALRVLLPIASFNIATQDDLYDAVSSIDWQKYISSNASFAINDSVISTIFSHSKFAVYRTKDAIVDQIQEKTGQRPKVNPKNPDVVIDIHLSEGDLNISLDSSGKSLHLRNYKFRQYKAPLSEVLAAGLLKIAGYDGDIDFHDPMCGSGTLVTEALMIAANIPSGMFIENFAFQNWPEYHDSIFSKIKETASSLINHPTHQIIGSDINRLAVRDLKKNLQKFPLKEKVKIFERDFFKVDGAPNRLLVFNPPYNKRVEIENVEDYYRQIGDALKKEWSGSVAWIISSNLEAIKRIGLRPSHKVHLNHGGQDARFYKFEMYEGSKKAKYN